MKMPPDCPVCGEPLDFIVTTTVQGKRNTTFDCHTCQATVQVRPH